MRLRLLMVALPFLVSSCGSAPVTSPPPVQVDKLAQVNAALAACVLGSGPKVVC